MFSRREIPTAFAAVAFCSASFIGVRLPCATKHERLLRMANFQVAQQQARARRAARDLAQQLLHCSLDELDAIEEQEAEVRYRFRCIHKVMRCRRSRRHAPDMVLKHNVPPNASRQSWCQQAS